MARQVCAQQGSVIAMFAVVLVVLIGFAGLAIELGQVFNRRAEVQALADAAALAAARQLNGSAAGIAGALAAAAERVSSTTDGVAYRYGQAYAPWSNAALAFGASASGPWLDAVSASAAPQGISFVRVDTGALGSALTQMDTLFMRVISSAFDVLQVSARAVAGPYSINITPLAICAMSPQAAAARGGELVEYGFRRGVSYDLMQLDPTDTDGVGAHYLIDPIAAPGTSGVAADFALETIKPMVCTGTLAMPRVTGGPITVLGPFPLAALYGQLNSRFGQYVAPCNVLTAPPDANIKAYSSAGFFGTTSSWMNASTPPLSGQAAARYPAAPSGGSEKLWTYADPWPLPAGTGPDKYGPLWSFARAVPFAAYVPGVAEPAGGYPPFAATQANWNALYPVNSGSGAPSLKSASYPGGSTATPYQATFGSFFAAPATGAPGLRNRRVLNIPLLSCPVPSGSVTPATVLAIGRFFMTVPADSSHLYAEFAGIAPEQALSGQLELKP